VEFRIRTDNWAQNDPQVRKYQEHLSRFNKSENSDLWRYFYWDFFHDGEINKITFWEEMGEVVFFITCPNIKRKTGNKFEFINLEFKCTFRDVVHFHFEHDNPEDFNFNQYNCPIFLASEINTLTEIIEKRSSEDNDFASLIIEVLGVDNSFFIELVFSQVDVEAIENTAFELMLASDDFEVPIYIDEEVK
jgi:hypothetical protein